MNRYLRRFGQLLRAENAATMVEYAVLMVFIAMSCIAAVTTFGSSLNGLFQRAVNGFSR